MAILMDNLDKKVDVMGINMISNIESVKRLEEKYDELKGQSESTKTKLRNIDEKQAQNGKYQSKQTGNTYRYCVIKHD